MPVHVQHQQQDFALDALKADVARCRAGGCDAVAVQSGCGASSEDARRSAGRASRSSPACLSRPCSAQASFDGAAPRPTMPATFSVPARLAALLGAAVDEASAAARRLRTYSAPTPLGPWNLWADRDSRSMFMRLARRWAHGPRPAPRRCGTARRALRQIAPISAMGWMVPISLLANMTETRAGLRPDAPRAICSGYDPTFAVHRDEGDLKALLLQPLCSECSRAWCSTAEVMMWFLAPGL